MALSILANGTSRELIALINAVPYAEEAVARHQREVLDARAQNISGDALRQLNADNDALHNAVAAALDLVAMYPAATGADLHTKLSFMAEYDMGNGQDWLPELLADAERIAGVAVVE